MYGSVGLFIVSAFFGKGGLAMYPYDPNNPNSYGQQGGYDPNAQQGNWVINNQGGSNQGFNNQPTYNQDYQAQSFNQQGFNSEPYSQPYSNPYGQINQGFNPQPNYNTFSSSQSNTSFNGFEIPDQFTMLEKLLTIGMDMKLQRNGSQFGFIRQKVLSIGRTFQLEDGSGAVVATAKEKILTIGRDFEIVDSSGVKIGSIVEQVLKSILSIHRKYTIKDRNDIPVATSKELDIFNKGSIQIMNSNGGPQAKFSQAWSAIFREQWEVNFYSNSVDRRLMIFFPVVSSQRQEEKSAARVANHNM